jgi:tetratricopeptide (TPR) repeat protein
VLEDAIEGLLRKGNIEAAAEAEALLGDVWLNRGERDLALPHFERASELVSGRGPSSEKAFVLQELARTLMMADELDRAIELGTESLRLAETLGLEATRSRNLNTIGVGRVVGDRGGLQDLERAIAIGATVHSHEEVSAAANLTWMHVLLGDLRRAGELHETSRSLAKRLGLMGFIRWMDAEHVLHCYWEGRWDEALVTADEYLHEIEVAPGHYMEGNIREARAAIWLARGQGEAALAEVRRGTELARSVKDPQVLNPHARLRGPREARGRRSGRRERARRRARPGLAVDRHSTAARVRRRIVGVPRAAQST